MAGFNLNDYVDVQTRITRFWKEYPEGSIRTSLASDPNNFEICRYRAEVFKSADNERPDATGYAFEVSGSGMANKTSHEENCETSAIGRALANLGYATSSKDRPSREEMGKVGDQGRPPVPIRGNTQGQSAPSSVSPQNAGNPPSDKQWGMIRAQAKKIGLEPGPEWTAYVQNITGAAPEQLTRQQASTLIDAMVNGTAPAPQAPQAPQANDGSDLNNVPF